MALELGTARNGQRVLVLKSDGATTLPSGEIAPAGTIVPLVATMPVGPLIPTDRVDQFGSSTSTFVAEELVWNRTGIYVYLTTPGLVTVQSDTVRCVKQRA